VERVPVLAPYMMSIRWNLWSSNIREHIQGIMKKVMMPPMVLMTRMGIQYWVTITMEIAPKEAATM
jgi:hypothetical protein